MRILRLVLPAVLSGLGLPGILEAQSQRTALLDLDKRAARVAGDSGLAEALRQVLRPDGLLLWPGAPILAGITDVQDYLAGRSPTAPVRLTWQPLEVEVSGDSTLAALWGVVAIKPPTPAATPGLGRFISVWERGRSDWSMSALVLIGNDIPNAGAVPRGIRLSRPVARFSRESQPFAAADRAFARMAQDSGAATAFRTWAGDDALIFGGGGLLTRGPEAIGSAVAGPARWDWHPVAAGGAPSGDLGWTVGEAVITGADGTSYSKYLTVWVQRGGITRFLLDGGNARPRP
jgi:hypothetical protein